MKRFEYSESYTIGNKAYTVLASDVSDEKIKNIFMMCYHLNNRGQALMLIGLLDVKRALKLSSKELGLKLSINNTVFYKYRYDFDSCILYATVCTFQKS
jgi:hypothetical protein